MSSLIPLIPRPARDLFNFVALQNLKSKAQEEGTVENLFVGILGGGLFALPLADNMIKAACRISLAALATFALYQFPVINGTTLVAGALISLPTTLIIAGSYMLYQGTALTIASVASGSFTTLAVGLASLTGGWIGLQHYDFIPFGIFEHVLNKFSGKYAPDVVRFVTK